MREIIQMAEGMAFFADSLRERTMPIIKDDKIGRNEPCPCGSNLKYKNCCLKLLNEAKSRSDSEGK